MDQLVTNEITFSIENNHLSARLGSLRNEERLCNITFRLKHGCEVKAHRAVVAAFSEYVMNMCTQNTNKFAVALVVNLPNTPIEDLERTLDFIYGVPLQLNWYEMQSLRMLAKDLLIADLDEAIGKALDDQVEDTKIIHDTFNIGSIQYPDTSTLEQSVKQEPHDDEVYSLSGSRSLQENSHGALDGVNHEIDGESRIDETMENFGDDWDEKLDDVDNNDIADSVDAKPENAHLDIEENACFDERRCAVCGYQYASLKYGAWVCGPCEHFFQRNHLQSSESETFKCMFDQNCQIDMRSPKKCPWCRLTKCREMGMKIEGESCTMTTNQADRADEVKGSRKRKEPTRFSSPSNQKLLRKTPGLSPKKKQSTGKPVAESVASSVDEAPNAENNEEEGDDETISDNMDDFQFVTTARPKNLILCYFCKQHIEAERMVEHETLCRKDRAFKCCVCEEKFPTHKKWKEHLNTHSDTIFCDICYSETFSSQTELIPHKREHFSMDSMRHYHSGELYGVLMKACDGAMLLQCVLCDAPQMLYTSSIFLSQHIRKEHKGLPFKCNLCGKIYSGSHGLRRHLERHIGMKNRFLCSECGKVYAQQKQLKAHSVTHILGKPFYCKLCNTGFDKEGEMRIHSKTAHTDKMDHICPQCGKGFISRHLMKRHVETSHVQKHVCSFCGKKFGRRTNLKTHERIHTSEKPYKCCVCNAAFAQLASIQWHYKKNHPSYNGSSKSEFTKVEGNTSQDAPFVNEPNNETKPAPSMEIPCSYGQVYPQPMYFNPYVGGMSN